MEDIYLDNAASTRVDPRVLTVLNQGFQQIFANPSNIKHQYGRSAKQALENSRASITRNLNLRAPSLIFTSGATEANNLALRGITSLQKTPASILISQIEHACVDESLKFLMKRGVKFYTIPTLASGQIDLIAAERLINSSPDLKLISVMAVNNETGVIQPIPDLIRLAKQKAIPVHTDATQAIGKVRNDIFNGADLISFSSHKINGPKGVGALWVSPEILLSPILVGGGQEAGLRSGTTPVPLCMAFAKAVEIAVTDSGWLTIGNTLRQIEQQIAQTTGAAINGLGAERVASISNLSFATPGALINKLSGLAVSSGAACGCAKPRPSKVLLAMGRSEQQATNSIRISADRFTTPSELFQARDIIIRAAKQ